jgi:hypothetical protein
MLNAQERQQKYCLIAVTAFTDAYHFFTRSSTMTKKIILRVDDKQEKPLVLLLPSHA